MGIRSYWNELKRGTPGKRFQQQYRKKHARGTSIWRKIGFLGGGAIILVAGLFFLPAPGPGWAIIFIGGGLIAQESERAAKVLDWTELRLRAVVEWALDIWKESSTPARAGIVMIGLLVIGGAVYAAYEIFIRK
jgi:uncharacterized protein (TIGR02611 family)